MNKYRILLVDDNVSIHEDFKQILSPRASFGDAEVQALESELFGAPEWESTLPYEFEINDAFQGEEALAMVESSVPEGRPYALVFMDVRMPPGMDGIQTIEQIWHNHPDIEMVICTAHSDYTWDEIMERFGNVDNLLFVKKPFDAVAIRQMAVSLIRKWERIHRSHSDKTVLESEVAARTAELAEMMKHLERLKEETKAVALSRSAFLADISSEIRTPLNGIMGITDLLLDTDLTDEQRGLVRAIQSSSDTLVVVANDADYLSRLGMDEKSSEKITFNVRTALETVAELCSIRSGPKGIVVLPIVDTSVPHTLTGDPEKLRDILLCLADNCLMRGRCTTIVVEGRRDFSQPATTERTGEVVVIFSVRRVGLINHEQTPADAMGNALLELAQKAVTKLGGGVVAANDMFAAEPFVFRLNLSDCPNSVNRPLAEPEKVRGTQVLVLGDNPISRKVLSLYINHWGGNSTEASTSDEAVEMLHTTFDTIRAHDMVLIDYDNADISAYISTAWTIRRHRNLHDVPLVCLTSCAQRGDANALMKQGYSAYLTKPIKQTNLHNAIALVKGHFKSRQTGSEPGIITKHLVDELFDERHRVLVVCWQLDEAIATAVQLHGVGLQCDALVLGQEPANCRYSDYELAVVCCGRAVDSALALRQSAHEQGSEIPILCVIDEASKAIAVTVQDFCSAVLYAPVNRDTVLGVLKDTFAF